MSAGDATDRVIRLLKIPAVKWSIGIALIAGTLTFIDPSDLADQLSSVRWAIAAPAVVGLALVHSINAFGWGLMTRLHTGLSMRPKRTIMVYYASQSIGLLTPSNIGSDIYRVASVAGETGGWKRAAAPVAAQRVTSFLALALIGLAATAIIPVSPALRISALAVTAALAAGLIGIAVMARNEKTLPGGRLTRWVPKMPESLSAGSGGRRSQIVTGLSTGVAFHTVSLCLGLALLSSISGEAPVIDGLAALAVIRLAILLPVSVSGLGFQEAAAAVVFPAIGLPAEVGVAVSMLTRIGLILTVASGAVCMSLQGPKREPEQAEPAETVDQRAA